MVTLQNVDKYFYRRKSNQIHVINNTERPQYPLHIFEEKELEDAMHYIKRMGTGRNRGYGRCTITIVKEA